MFDYVNIGNIVNIGKSLTQCFQLFKFLHQRVILARQPAKKKMQWKKYKEFFYVCKEICLMAQTSESSECSVSTAHKCPQRFKGVSWSDYMVLTLGLKNDHPFLTLFGPTVPHGLRLFNFWLLSHCHILPRGSLQVWLFQILLELLAELSFISSCLLHFIWGWRHQTWMN